MGCILLGEQPTFNCFTNIRANILYGFALGDASRQCRHFRPETAFFRFMNEHLQGHKWILLHRPIPRKTDPRISLSLNTQPSTLIATSNLEHQTSLFTSYFVVETRSLPAFARSYPRRFTFCVAPPSHSILPFSFLLPQYTAV